MDRCSGPRDSTVSLYLHRNQTPLGDKTWPDEMKEYEFIGDLTASYWGQRELSEWETFQNHREIVSGFIDSMAPPAASSLCVLGAGCCRDIDLNQLLRRFSRIALIDLNEQDLRDGLRHQNLAMSAAIDVVGALDVSGVHDLLNQYAHDPEDGVLDDIIRIATAFELGGLQTYDCVASTCLLSQILCHASEAVSRQHPAFPQLFQALRQRHVEIMLSLLNSGGTGLLVTDFVSSESLPELYETTDLKSTLQSAIASENVLLGLNPSTVGNLFNHQQIQPEIRTLKITDPWRWVMPQRIYACFAIIFSKR